MIGHIAFLCALTLHPGAAKHGESYIHEIDTTGGSGGAGGAARMTTVIECKVPGACTFDQKAVGGNGGSGGAALGTVRQAPNPGPVVARDEEPSLQSIVSSCKLLIGGKTEVDAKKCDFSVSPSSKKTSVSAPSANGKYRYTVTWLPNGNGSAESYLQGGSTGRVRALGTLRKSGACWAKDDESVRICAWK